MKVKFYMLPPAFWEGKSATLPFRMTNTLHMKRSQYQSSVLSFLLLWKYSCVWLLDDSAFESTNDSTSVPIGKFRKCLSLAECIVSHCKQKKIYFFPFGAPLQLFWFFVCSAFHRCSKQKSCGYTWGLYLVVKMVVHDLCSSLSNITCQILPSLLALTGCDTTSSFFRIGKNIIWRVVWFSFTDQCWSWNYNKCSKTSN